MAFADLDAAAKERLRDDLDLTGRNFSALLNNRRDAVRAFRCVCAYGDALADGQATIDRWIRFSERALLIPSVPGMTTLDNADELHDDDAAGAMLTGASLDEAEQMRGKLRAQQSRDKVEQAASVVPPWRESSAPQWGKFNRQLSTVGSGLAKRTLQSTAAVSNMIAALAPLNTEDVPDRSIVTNELVSNPVVLTRSQMEQAFLFATRGADLLDFDNFIVLEHTVAAARYPHNYRDDASAAVRRLHADYLRNCIRELSPETFEDINCRGPIVRYPDVSEVLFIHRRCVNAVMELFAGSISKKIDVDDVLRLCSGVGALEAPHMTSASVKQCMCAALRVSLSGLPTALAHDEFVDSLCFISFYLYSFEPHKSTLCTVASRVHAFLQSWSSWYERTLSEPLQRTLQPLPPGPPFVTGFSANNVNARASHIIDVQGLNFGNEGVFIRFGRLISAAPRCTESSATVHVPPASVDRITVRLRTEGDDFIVQLVHFVEVDVSVSRDGHAFSAPCATKFVYEDASPEVPVVTFQPKLLRIYQSYCRHGAAKSALDTSTAAVMKEAQWKKVLGEFHLVRSASGETPIDPTEEELASEAYRDELAAMSPEERRELEDERAIGRLFGTYSTEATGRITEKPGPNGAVADPDDDGASAKIRTLNFDRFVRALVHATVVSRGSDIVAGLRVILASDKWVGRELLDDIPAAHKGDLALRIRRAANSFQLVKVVDHMSHNNSPREGVWSVPAMKRELSHLPGGRWANEHDHDAMTLEFLAHARDNDEEAFAAIAEALRPIYDEDAPRVSGPPVDPTVDPPAVRHSEINVADDAFIPGLRHEAAPAMQQQLTPVPTDAVAAPDVRKQLSPAPPVVVADGTETDGPLPELAVDGPGSSVSPTPAGVVQLGPAARSPATRTPAAGKSVSPSRRASRRGSASTGPDGGLASPTIFTFQSHKATPAEERRGTVRKLAKNLTVHAQRQQLARVQNHATTKAGRHKREMERLVARLEEERLKREEVEQKLAEATRYTVPEEDLKFESHPTVLRAEKEALQKEFVRQVERKKNKLESDMAHVEIMRDLERDHVVTELRERMHKADFMYKRLQETVRGQSESIKREAELIGVLKTRVLLLLEDSRFFRDTHENLLGAVDRGKNKELIENLEAARHEHEIVMVELTQQLAAEARNEGRRAQKSLKENMPKRRPNQPMPEDAESLLRDAAANRDAFELGEGPTLVATFTEDEVAEERAKAVTAASEQYVSELAAMDRRLSEANEAYENQVREAVAKVQAEKEEADRHVDELKGRELAQQEESIELASRLQALAEEVEQYKSKIAEFEANGGQATPSRRDRRKSRRSRSYSITGSISNEASSAGGAAGDMSARGSGDFDDEATGSGSLQSTMRALDVGNGEGDAAGAPLTIQLQPASPATSLLVTPSNRPNNAAQVTLSEALEDDGDAGTPASGTAGDSSPSSCPASKSRRKSRSQRRKSSAAPSVGSVNDHGEADEGEPAANDGDGSVVDDGDVWSDAELSAAGSFTAAEASTRSRRKSVARPLQEKEASGPHEGDDSAGGDASTEQDDTSLDATGRSSTGAFAPDAGDHDGHEHNQGNPAGDSSSDAAPLHASMSVSKAAASRRRSERPRRSTRASAAELENTEMQTELHAEDVLSVDEDEDLAWVTQFGRLRNPERVDHIEHALNDGDTVEGVAAAYGVTIGDLLTANFLAAPEEPLEDMDDETLAGALDEINVALRGIPSRRLTVPVPLGMKTEIADMVATTHEAGAPMVLESSVRRQRDEAADSQQLDDTEQLLSAGTTPTSKASRKSAALRSTPQSPSPVMSPVKVVDDLPERASALASVATSLKDELVTLRSLVADMPRNALGAVLGNSEKPWEEQLSTLMQQLQPPPPAPEPSSAVELQRGAHGSMRRLTSMNKTPSRLRPVASKSSSKLQKSESTSVSILAAIASTDDAADGATAKTPAGLMASESIARVESVASMGHTLRSDGDEATTESPQRVPLSGISEALSLPRASSQERHPDIDNDDGVAVSDPLATGSDLEGVSPPVAALMPTAIARASTADHAERRDDEDLESDGASPLDTLDGPPVAGPVLDYDVSDKIRPFGALKHSRKLKAVSVARAEADDVRTIKVWVEAAREPSKSGTVAVAKPAKTAAGHLVVSGAGAAPGALPLRQSPADDASPSQYSAPMPMRARGQTLPHAGLGGALLMAEKHGRLQLVLTAEAAFEATFNDFIHRMELLARGSVTTGSKPRSTQFKPKAGTESTPVAPTAAAIKRAGHVKSRTDDEAETRMTVQQRRAEEQARQQALRELRAETLEERATAAVRQKRMLNERVKQRREQEAMAPLARKQHSTPEPEATPSRRATLPPIAATPPPPVSKTSVAVGPSATSPHKVARPAIPASALTPEPKPSFPGAVRRQIASVAEVDERLRLAREKQALDALLHGRHAAAGNRRAAADNAPFRGGAVLHPDLDDVLGTMQPGFAKTAPASHSAPNPGQWSRGAKAKPLRVPPLDK